MLFFNPGDSEYLVRLERANTGSAVTSVETAKTVNEAMNKAQDRLGSPWIAVACECVTDKTK